MFLIFGYPRVIDVVISRVTVSVADLVIEDNLLRDGGEYWEVITDDKKQIGFQRTIIRNKYAQAVSKSTGRSLPPIPASVYFEQQSRLMLLRRGELFDVAMTLISESDADGFFVSGKLQTKTSFDPIETNFQVQDDKLIILTGKTENSIAWNKAAGADAVIRSLLHKPMQSGEKRTIIHFDLNQSQIVETILDAGDIRESDRYGNKKLLEISVQNNVAGKTGASGFYYTDRGGNIIYTETTFGNRTISTLRTSKRYATSIISNNNPVEYGNIGEILLSEPIIAPRESSPISFLVKINNTKNDADSIDKRFAVSPFQKVEVVDSQSVIITVWSSIGNDPTQYGNNEYKIENNVTNNTEQLEEYLASCGLIDLDDPNLQQFALSVKSDNLTVWQTAVAMEGLVSKSIRSSSLSFGFASSSEVLRTRRGDCTERAVLLAALCRKKGIPARVVLGLAYSNQQNKNDNNTESTTPNKMVFHLWNEVYVEGIWRPLDATYGLGGADAARIKITD
ncbi:MAG: lasso peptide biosynthesis protein, partial [Planctomycetaceae bacterium]|nr:lasso peptide biosynthesis protein [Planctomycetaceae bacterium]